MPTDSSALILHDSRPDGLPVVAGVPFISRREVDSVAPARVEFADGTSSPAQGCVLNCADALGVQWIELSFLAKAGGKARVSLTHDTDTGGLARTAPEGVELQNETARVILDARISQPPIRFERRGDSRSPWKSIGALHLEVVTDHGCARTGARSVRILRNGPIRAQVEITGQLAGEDGHASLTWRLTVELWKGFDAARVDWRMSHLVPRVANFTVTRASLLGRWDVGADAKRHFIQSYHGDFYQPREVVNPGQVAIVSDFTSAVVHVSDPAMRLDTHEYAPYLMPPTVDAEPWLALKGSDGAVYAQPLDFGPTRPNRLESHDNTLDFHMIPDGNPTRWPQGRSVQQTIFYAFADAATGSTARARPLLAALAYQGRAHAHVETLTELKRFEMPQVMRFEPGRNMRIHGLLHRMCGLKLVGEKWNLGDTVETSYSQYYAGIPNRFEKLPHSPDIPRRYTPQGALFPASAVDWIEPVWSNNEYDIIHAIVQESCRTGQGNFLTTLRWVARHNLDVDFCAHSDHRWHHRATPAHSAHHNTTGAYPSHFWTQGLLQYFLLTGDRDALEVAVALGDKIIENFNDTELRKIQWGFNREIGWGLLSLVSLVEMTGHERFRKECDHLADFLQGYERAKFTGAVNLSNGRPGRSLERQMVDNGFGYASMVEAMDRYQHVSQRKDTAAWMLDLLQELKRQTWIAIGEGEIPSLYSMVPLVMALGYERTADPDFLQAGVAMLEAGLDGGIDWNGVGEIKTNAMIHRSLCRFAGHADRAGLLDRFEWQAVREHRASK